MADVTINALVAMDEGRVIGVRNTIPWHVPEDMQRLKKLTTGHTVLMGRKTYDSLPDRFRPLPNRHNVVVTRNNDWDSKHEAVQVIADPIRYIEEIRGGTEKLCSSELWILGGAEIYKLLLPICDQLYLTVIHSRHVGDAYFPEFEGQYRLVDEDNREGYSFRRYQNTMSGLSSAG